MSIGQIASSLWSSATTALMSPNAATTPVSVPSTRKANGSGAGNATTGSSNPFQALSPDLQSWLNQNQTSGIVQHTHRHHHHGGGANQAAESYAASNSLSAAPGTPSATAAAA
jgi:hypothetical protein